MENFTEILINATAQISEGYFQLKIDGGDPIYRERVYCYELYHQLRNHWPDKTDFYLNGEIDKAAHPILKDLGVNNVKPDFLVHKPGYMYGNYAIIEVKKVDADLSGIRKDLQTLSIFLENVQYERAIYLFYGYSINYDKLLNRLSNVYLELNLSSVIEIWFHNNHEQSAECILKLGCQ